MGKDKGVKYKDAHITVAFSKYRKDPLDWKFRHESPTIKFLKKNEDGTGWLVEYKGPYYGNREPQVIFTGLKNRKSLEEIDFTGAVYRLRKLHKNGRAFQFHVVGIEGAKFSVAWMVPKAFMQNFNSENRPCVHILGTYMSGSPSKPSIDAEYRGPYHNERTPHVELGTYRQKDFPTNNKISVEKRGTKETYYVSNYYTLDKPTKAGPAIICKVFGYTREYLENKAKIQR